jgi:hypothetical protein
MTRHARDGRATTVTERPFPNARVVVIARREAASTQTSAVVSDVHHVKMPATWLLATTLTEP